MVSKHSEEHGLNRCLEAVGLPKSTWYYRQRRKQNGPSQEEQTLVSAIRDIIAEHPAYGYRRILPELRARIGLRVNHKRLKRLLNQHDLRLRRCLPAPRPSAARRTLRQHAGKLDLVKKRLASGSSFDVLEAFSTDFTELNCRGGKAHLMAMVCIESRYVAGWAVGRSANRELALKCWRRAKQRLAELGRTPIGLIVHHDQDSVYTSHDWLRALLVEDGAKVSYSENGAKDNPWIESLWGRFKTENESLIAEAMGTVQLTEIVGSSSKTTSQPTRADWRGWPWRRGRGFACSSCRSMRLGSTRTAMVLSSRGGSSYVAWL